MFENEVLKKIPEKVKLGIIDWKEKDDESEEIKEWIKNYNVQYLYSSNSSCLHHFSQAKDLKVLFLRHFPSCEVKDLDILLQLKTLHTLRLGFNVSVK